MGASILLIHKAGTHGIVSARAEFVTLDERFKMLRQVDWEALKKDQPALESAAAATAN